MAITAIASPFLDNVTTIMLVAPVTIVVCNRLRVPAQPYLIAEVLASNIGGAATLIGDPPNIIVVTLLTTAMAWVYVWLRYFT